MNEHEESVLEVLEILNNLQVPYQEAVDSRPLTTFFLGGRLSVLIKPDNLEQLKSLTRKRLDYRVLGRGSNIFFCFERLDIPVIKLGHSFRQVEFIRSNYLEVGAACHLDSLARKLSTSGFSGLEFAVGIPGTVGGAIIMNAGAHGGQMADVVERVRFVYEGEEIETKPEFVYRGCELPPKAIVTAAVLRVTPGDNDRVLKQVNQNLEYRRATQPLNYPSLGSVFKNPSKEVYAGSLLEEVGLKGYRKGNVMFSELHANWLINPEKKGSYAEVQFLLSLAQAMVLEKFGIKLELEWRVFDG
ncbi:MAG: UDP-N-acetylmuramate dehydrogenase [Thermoplasmatales archaeon]